jgi:elongation factor Ts
MISAKLVKELRDITGAGMMDCKKALVETNGNIEEAVTWLREKGIAKAAKKTGRIAAEGVCSYLVEGNKAIVFELNSETDFVAISPKFQEVVKKIGEVIIASDVTNTEEALNASKDGETVNDIVVNATAVIGEKISLRRVSAYTKTDSQAFGGYSHMNGKMVGLTVVEGANEEVAKDVSMHVVAMNPKYLNINSVNQENVEKEKEILTQEALNEGKPADIVAKMVVGRLQKYLKEICLENQPFVKNPDQTVEQFVKANNGKILSFIRLEVGEGIEKKVEDFAAEVNAQLNN